MLELQLDVGSDQGHAVIGEHRPVRWEAAAPSSAAAALEAAGFSPLMASLLARRGITDPESAAGFLSPTASQLHDPGALRGLDEAVERLVEARRAEEAVVVVGDYDVDGVTSTAMLLAVLGAGGLSVSAILPQRMREGYGFQPLHVDEAVRRGAGLVVTVDCGTTSYEAVEKALAGGLSVIVVDHHLPGARSLPPAVILVNPKQPGCHYPEPRLAAAGLTLKLALAVAEALDRRVPLEALLRIAALGTIADLVPLLGENRTIAALGLEALGKTRSKGLLALMRRAGLRGRVRAEDVGFRIGPRINAAGRLGDAGLALELLVTRDAERAETLARTLDEMNSRRQDEEAQVVAQARDRILDAPELPPILVASDPGWHRGVVGIAAGRLARELNRPTILLAEEGTEAIGSGRSIPGIELHAFLVRWREELERFGGHAQAVGLTVRRDRLDELRDAWVRTATEEWQPSQLEPSLEYEAALGPGDLTPELLTELGRLEPHGMENRRPVFRIGPLVTVGRARAFSRGHLRGLVKGGDGQALGLIGWRMAERLPELDGHFEVLATVENDRMIDRPGLVLVDVRPVDADRPSSTGEDG